MTLRRPYGGRKVAVRRRKVLKQLREQNSLLTKFLNMFKILHDVSTPHEIATVIVQPLTAPTAPYGPSRRNYHSSISENLFTSWVIVGSFRTTVNLA